MAQRKGATLFLLFPLPLDHSLSRVTFGPKPPYLANVVLTQGRFSKVAFLPNEIVLVFQPIIFGGDAQHTTVNHSKRSHSQLMAEPSHFSPGAHLAARHPLSPSSGKAGFALLAGLLLVTPFGAKASEGEALASRVKAPKSPSLTLVSQLSSARPRRAWAFAPKARLMPSTAQMRATAFVAPLFPAVTFRMVAQAPQGPRLSAVPAMPTLTARLQARGQNAKSGPQELRIGGGKFVRVAENTQIAAGGETLTLSTLPSAQMLPPKAEQTAVPALPVDAKSVAQGKATAPKSVANLAGMKKVIQTENLSKPQLNAPLPDWMKASAVKVEKLDKRAPKTQLAQNPSAPPLRSPANPVTNSDRLANQIEVSVSTFVVLLTTTDLQTVAVADPTIADVAVVNSRAVLLNGKATGTTSLVIVDGQKIRQYTVRVTSAPGTRPVDVAEAIGIPGVTVRQVQGAIVLEGEVGTEAESKRAEQIAGLYAPRVVNQLAIRPVLVGAQNPASLNLASQVRELIANPAVEVRATGETVILTGTLESQTQINDAETIAKTLAPKVLNLLRLPKISVEKLRESLNAYAQLPAPLPGQTDPAPGLVVREVGDQVLIEGTAASQNELEVALQTAARTGYSVVNRATVRAALGAEQQFTATVSAAIGRPNVIVRGTPKRLVLEGTVNDTNEAVLAEQVARGFATQVDNMLRTTAPLQVDVDVNIMEINRTKARQLGIEFGSATLLGESFTQPTFNQAGQQVTAGFTTRTIDPAFRQGTLTAGNGFAGGGPTQILDPLRFQLRSLQSTGNGRTLSNPRTTVLSGRTATFQVGGQVPIPVGSTSNAAGTSSTIEFKDYGILLDIVPNTNAKGITTLRVRTEISQPDFSTGVTPPGGGSPIPGFRRRSSVTEVTVPANGTLALSGLITNEDTQTKSGVPILSKIPILGRLFESKDFRNNQTELVVFISPRLQANPLRDGEDAWASPHAVGENTNRATQLSNPGLTVFNEGAAIAVPTTGGGGAAR